MTKSITPPALAVDLPVSALDMVPLGIVKVNHLGKFTYANKALMEMAGVDHWDGYGVEDFFHGKDLQKVRTAIESRFKRKMGSDYRVFLAGQRRNSPIPVSITGFPETDASGAVIGALGIIRDLTVDRVHRRMFEIVQQETDCKTMLHDLAKEILKIVPFDMMSIIVFNKAKTHLRSFFTLTSNGQEPVREFRWWRIPRSVKPLLDGSNMLLINGMREWYEEDADRRELLKDRAVQQFLGEGYVSALSYPIVQNGERVATVGLYRKNDRTDWRFTPKEEQIVSALPLSDAISVAIRHESEGNLQFLIDLINEIVSAYDNSTNVAKTIVDKIFDHYKWDYVSIFQVYPQQRSIRLIAQHAVKDEMRAPDAFSLPIDSGVLGFVYRTGQSVNINDLENSVEFKDVYVKGPALPTRSELCVPIGASRRWLINVEDTRTEAFAEEEMKSLQMIAGALTALLDRSIEYQYRKAIFNRANDAIVLTDDSGVIVEANEATVRLLRCEGNDITDRSIAEFVADPEVAKWIVEKGTFLNREVVMRDQFSQGGHETKEIRVLLSAAELPAEIGGRVIVATDMTLYYRYEQLQFAESLYREVTNQVKTPMSLAMAWLRRRDGSRGTDEVTGKVLQQLQKVELTLDRMMLIEHGVEDDIRHEAPLRIDSLIDGVMKEFPAHERAHVKAALRTGDAIVRADPYELRYCLLTMLSYLLRVVPEDGSVRLAAETAKDDVTITVRGRSCPPAADDGYVRTALYSQTMSELAFGEKTLQSLIRRNGGSLEIEMGDDADFIEFRIRLPQLLAEVVS